MGDNHILIYEQNWAYLINIAIYLCEREKEKHLI